MIPLRPVTSVAPPADAARRTASRRFLGEELSSEPEPSSTRWLIKAVLGGTPHLALSEDGVLPAQVDGLLPLRHGVTTRGAPAACLLEAVERLARMRVQDVDARDVECSACRAWLTLRQVAQHRSSPPMILRLRTVLDEVFGKAA